MDDICLASSQSVVPSQSVHGGGERSSRRPPITPRVEVGLYRRQLLKEWVKPKTNACGLWISLLRARRLIYDDVLVFFRKTLLFILLMSLLWKSFVLCMENLFCFKIYFLFV